MDLDTLNRATAIKRELDLTTAAITDYQQLCESVPSDIERLVENEKKKRAGEGHTLGGTGWPQFTIFVKSYYEEMHNQGRLVDNDGAPITTKVTLRTQAEWRLLAAYLKMSLDAMVEQKERLESELAAIK